MLASKVIILCKNGSLCWLLGGHLGSTAYTVNGTTESGETRYFPWGKDRFTSGTTPTRYRFTGQREEASLGLYYYGARWYDPALGRFIQPDTIVPNPGDAQAFDRYAYTLNNPLKYVDPTGHQATCTMDAQNNMKCSDNAVTGGQTLTIDLADEPRSNNSDGTGFFMTMGGLLIGSFAAPFVAPYVAALLPAATEGGTAAVTAACADGDCTNEAKAVSQAVQVADKVSKAYQIAKEGGKHAGFLKNYVGRSVEQVRRGISSFEELIAEHRDKIANPEKYLPHFRELDPRQQEALLTRKWPADIQRQTEQLEILKGLLDELLNQ